MRDLGDTTAYLRRGMREILCLALFFFTFLACEYLFDARMVEFVPSSEVVIYESIVAGASVIGFFVRPFLYYRCPQTIDATSDITGVLLVSALLLMIMAVRFEVVIAGGLVACCALGYCGSTAHANLARRFAQTPCLARAVAVSYAVGILVQVLNHMVMPAGIPQQSVLIACAIALVGLLHGVRRAKLRDESAPEFEVEIAELSVDASEHGAKWRDNPEAKAAFQGAVVRLTVATACLTGVFAALNAGLTTSHAAGAIDLGDWPRLLLVVSALAAGALYDLRGRSYMNIIMTCAAISMYARWSYLWPCMGRAINNICSMLVTAPAVAIISSQNVLMAVGVVLVLFVGIAISLLGQFGQGVEDEADHRGLAFATDDLGVGRAPDQTDAVPLEAPELSFDDRLDGFVAAFGLTKRERDVLEALVVSDDSVQDVAAALFLSRSTLYRHIASINKKTGAASRVALINFFWSWTPQD